MINFPSTMKIATKWKNMASQSDFHSLSSLVLDSSAYNHFICVLA